MRPKEVLLSELDLKPMLLRALQWIGERAGINQLDFPISKIIPFLGDKYNDNGYDIKKMRGVGEESIIVLRNKLKELGYNYKNCPFLFEGTMDEAKQELQKKLQHRNLTKKQLELIWEVACERLWIKYDFSD